MPKSSYEKAVEKQIKENRKLAREDELRNKAIIIVQNAKIIDGFSIMDTDSEAMLGEILKQYDGNEDNYIEIDIDKIPRNMQSSISLQLEKLQMYGNISDYKRYIYDMYVTISENGKSYFKDKEEALKKEKKISEKKLASERKQYDVFISHANKDKNDYVDLLNAKIKRLGINVFYDTDVLSWGDNWKQVILEGTANSEFAIIVISKNFFGREWTEKELTEFLSQQNESGQKIVLPLLYGISLEELKEHYPQLEAIQCINSDDFSKEEIVILLTKELIKRYKN